MDCQQLQIKQNHFYFRDEDMISEILELDTSPFSFEIGFASIPIDVQYGSKRAYILVDSCCEISLLKLRFCKVYCFCGMLIRL